MLFPKQFLIAELQDLADVFILYLLATINRLQALCSHRSLVIVQLVGILAEVENEANDKIASKLKVK